jgi:hypothetical protein
MHRLFGFLALAAGALAAWVLFTDPAIDPLSGGKRMLSEAPNAYSAWAMGVLMGLALAWLAIADWSKLQAWLRLQRRRLGLLILGGVIASVFLLLR